jgi:hypothetical protein
MDTLHQARPTSDEDRPYLTLCWPPIYLAVPVYNII